MNQYAVNPQTGDVAEFDGQAWKPVDKSRVARSQNGQTSVYNGQAWQTLGGNQAQADEGQTAPMPAARPDTPLNRSITEQAGLPRGAGLAIRDTLAGLSTLPYIGADAAAGVANLATGGIDKLAGTNIPKFGIPSRQRDATLDQWFPKPTSGVEKVISGANQFALQVPTMAGAATASGIKALEPLAEKLGSQLVGSTVGGAGFGGAQAAFPNNPVVQLAAALGGTLLGGKGASMASNTAEAAERAAATPTTQMLKDTASGLYKTADNAGVIVKPNVMQDLASSVKTDLADLGYHPGLQPRIGTVLSELDRVGTENISLKGIDVVRRIVANAASSQDPSERMMAGRIIDKLDEVVQNLKPTDVLEGDSQVAVKALTEARSTWSQMRKSQMIDEIIPRAENSAARTNSGGNYQNKVRQGIDAILASPSKRRGFTSDELAAMTQLVRGTPTENTLRTLGRLAPSSNAWLGVLTTWGLPGGIGVPIVGGVSKAIASRLTNKNIDALSELVRSGGKLPPKPAGMSADSYKRALVQALSGPSASQQGAVPASQQLLGSLLSRANGPDGNQPQGRRP